LVSFHTGASLLFSEAPGMAVRLNQPPVQWVIVAPFLRVKQRKSESIHSLSY